MERLRPRSYTLNANTLASNYVVDTILYGTLEVMSNTISISVASESNSWDYDGLLHRDDRYIVMYDTLILDQVVGNPYKFALPTKDTLTITSTFNGITHVDSNASNNNTFTYTLQHDDQYIG